KNELYLGECSMTYRNKMFYIVSLFTFLTACGNSQENTAQEETPEETIEIQDEVPTDETEQSDEEQDSMSEATNEEETAEEETRPAETESEFQWLYDELNGKSFIFSSGVGAWGTSIRFLDEGNFLGEYSDANGPEMVVSEFTGHFDIQKEIDEFTYLLDLNNLQITSDTGKEEVDGEMTITYVEEPHGFQ